MDFLGFDHVLAGQVPETLTIQSYGLYLLRHIRQRNGIPRIPDLFSWW